MRGGGGGTSPIQTLGETKTDLNSMILDTDADARKMNTLVQLQEKAADLTDYSLFQLPFNNLSTTFQQPFDHLSTTFRPSFDNQKPVPTPR